MGWSRLSCHPTWLSSDISGISSSGPWGFLVSVRTPVRDSPSYSLLLVEEALFSGWIRGCPRGKREALLASLEFLLASSFFCKPGGDNSTPSGGEAQERGRRRRCVARRPVVVIRGWGPPGSPSSSLLSISPHMHVLGSNYIYSFQT